MCMCLRIVPVIPYLAKIPCFVVVCIALRDLGNHCTTALRHEARTVLLLLLYVYLHACHSQESIPMHTACGAVCYLESVCVCVRAIIRTSVSVCVLPSGSGGTAAPPCHRGRA
jgi:hypothetical protein